MHPGPDPALVEAAHAAISSRYEVVYAELPYAVTLDGRESGDFLFRSMSYKQFDAFSRTAQLGDITDLVVRELIVYPLTKWEENPIQQVEAGSFDELALFLVSASGFDSKKTLYEGLNVGRGMAATPFSAAQMFISKAFPGVTPGVIGDMTATEMFRHVAMAEHLLGQEGKALQFPLREIMGDVVKRDRGSTVPWHAYDKMRVLTPQQIEQMKTGDRARYVVEKLREKRALEADPEAKANRMRELRQNRRDEIMARKVQHLEDAGENESAILRQEFGGLKLHGN